MSDDFVMPDCKLCGASEAGAICQNCYEIMKACMAKGMTLAAGVRQAVELGEGVAMLGSEECGSGWNAVASAVKLTDEQFKRSDKIAPGRKS